MATHHGGRAPFSFHCVVCYEAFRPKTRPPVVLPCGHTFVCETCASRLTACMECRTSLFVTAPAAAASAPSPGGAGYHQQRRSSRTRPGAYGAGRSGGATTPPPHPPPKAEKIPLPLPKNVVMIAMMEAAEAEAKAAAARRRRGRRRRRRNNEAGSEGSSSDTDSVMSNLQKDDDDDDEKFYDSGDDDSAVHIGMKSLSARYGTYAVRAKDGLAVLRQHPLHSDKSSYSKDKLSPSCNGDGCALKDEDQDIPLQSDTAVTEEASFEEEDGAGSDNAGSMSPLLGDDLPWDEKVAGEDRNASDASPVDEDVIDEESAREGQKAMTYCDSSKDQRQEEVKEVSAGPESEGEEKDNSANEQKVVPQTGTGCVIPDKSDHAREDKDLCIKYGQTVQVVGFSDGVATLARGSGYIVASKEQLVKIGPPLDEACEIEGKLLEAEETMRRHETKLAESRKCHASLREDLKEAVSKAAKDNQECPVIGPPLETKQVEKVDDKGETCKGDEESKDHTDGASTPARAGSPTLSGQGTHVAPVTPEPGGRSASASYTPHTIDNSELRAGHSRVFSGHAGGIPRPGEIGLPYTFHRQDTDSDSFLSGLGCIPLTPFLGTEADRYLSNGPAVAARGEIETRVRGGGASFDSAIEVGPDGILNGGRGGHPSRGTVPAATPPRTPDRSRRAPHHLPGSGGGHAEYIQSSPSASFDTIDYRTGFSCHRGVGSSRHRSDHVSVHAQEERARAGMRMMGEHRGIGSLRSMRNRSMGSSQQQGQQQQDTDLLHHPLSSNVGEAGPNSM